MIGVFSILTLKSVGAGKYTYTTGAGGILSAFVVLAGFIICYTSKSRLKKIGATLFALFLFVLSIRGPILSAIVFVAVSRGVRLVDAVKIGVGISCVLIIVYLIVPDSRIFDLHMSGRWLQWVMIWNEFDWARLLFGMGDYAATGILLNHSVGETMAAPHNEILRIFYDFGLIGIIMLFLCLKKITLMMKSQGKPYIFAMFVPLIFDNAFSYFFSFVFLFFLAGFLKDFK
ncbi:hypothetical protein PA25_26170 [Pseudoalteromonas sp. A25]|nr:hypothetical protein PA25_26170 [Pseudoalteromonas sp. A25]